MKRVLIITGTVLVMLVLAWTALVGASPAASPAAPVDAWPPTPPAGNDQPWKAGFEPGIYLLHDYSIEDPYRYGLVGGVIYVNWSDVEDQVQGQYDWSMVDNWIAQEAASGKKAGIAITTYNGRSAQKNGFANGLPTYIQNNPKAAYKDIDGWALPLYWKDDYLNPYHDFVRALGEKYRDDPRVAWIAIGLGRYGELRAYDHADDCPDHPDHEFMVDTYGFNVSKWQDAVKKMIDFYVDAFSEDGELKKELFAQTATYSFSAGERRNMANYAAEHGVGLSINGLYPDQEQATTDTADPLNPYIGQYDQIFLWGEKVPIAFETYDYMLCNENHLYWGILNGLDKHPDVFRLSIDLFKDSLGNDRPENMAIIKWAKNYLGATITNTPSIWVAMREHRDPWQVCWQARTSTVNRHYYPQWGNYSFWLYQDDSIPGGLTVPETYMTTTLDGHTPLHPEDPPGISRPLHPNPALPHVKEAWVIRRTDEASGNPYMWFKVDDRYIFGGSHRVTVTVTYLDMYTDTWDLSYDSVTGEKIARPLGSSVDYVQKEGTKEVRKAVFVLPDARFANGLTGGADFRISSRGDGDEWIHMVDVTDGRWKPPVEPTPMPTATPVATPTPATGSVHGLVWRDANQDGTPQPSESGIPAVQVQVKNLQGTPIAEATTDASGLYSMSGIEPSAIPYKVVETDPDGCTSTTPNEVLKVFQAGVDWEVNFGDYCTPTPTPTPILADAIYLPLLLK